VLNGKLTRLTKTNVKKKMCQKGWECSTQHDKCPFQGEQRQISIFFSKLFLIQNIAML
jgi:hypothetical protein